jgi:hypothetical protein
MAQENTNTNSQFYFDLALDNYLNLKFRIESLPVEEQILFADLLSVAKENLDKAEWVIYKDFQNAENSLLIKEFELL